ncbi:hypothetical protein QUF80_23835 [Desulfococcaceae bacterium HSG8]|nr:hypothetical protein [Desulfococcaceae bacterium HSG8]
MKLSAPRRIVWIISVLLGILGIIGKFVSITFVSANAFWFVTAGFAVLVLATLFKGI